MIGLSSQKVSGGSQNNTESMRALFKRVRRPEIEVSAFETAPIRLHLLHRALVEILRHCAILVQEVSFSFTPFLPSAWNSVVVLSFWRSPQG
jgi:hypothetical protein